MKIGRTHVIWHGFGALPVFVYVSLIFSAGDYIHDEL